MVDRWQSTVEVRGMFTSMPTVSRRTLLKFTVGAAGTSLLAACGQQASAPAAQEAKPAAPAPTQAVQIAVPTPAQAAPAAAAAPTAAAAAAKPTDAPAAAAAKPTDAPKPAAAANAQVKRGGSLHIHRQNDWPTLDPHTAQTNSLDMILTYDYLTRVDQNAQTGAWEVKPGLAASWELPDPQTVVFKLQPNVKFHDGTDFNAEAVKWNLNRMMTHPKSSAKIATAAIDTIEVVDPLTIRLKLKAPSPTLFVNLSAEADNVGGMMSPTWAEKVGDAGIANSSVGTGPFKLTEYQPSNQVSYKKFDGYWKQGADGKPLPYPDDATVKYQQDWNAALVSLRSGDFDLVNGVAGRDVPTIEQDPKISVFRMPWASTMYQITFNARPGARFAGDKMKPVRQAINYAIDREAIAKALGAGIGDANYQHLVPGQIGYNESIGKFEYDPDKAKKMLSDAGFGSGLEVTVDIISRPEDQQNAQAYQQMLDKVGIKMTIRPSERVAWVQKSLAGDFEMGTFLSGVRPDPDLVLGYRFQSDGSGNYMGWADDELDKLLKQGRTIYDAAQRQTIYENVQKKIAEEAYVLFVWRRQGVVATQKALQGFVPPWTNAITMSTELWLNR
jgi:peptide/nickel transport system substrate-binding protein